MELKEIQELIKIIDESGLTSFELEKEGFRLVLKKDASQALAAEAVPGVITGQALSGIVTGEAVAGVFTGQLSESAGAGYPQQAASDLRAGEQTIDSPIVGTFYASPSPGEPPFVVPGSKVKKGSVLCIIEAMKLMNEIEAEEDLEVIEVLAANGQMVEYGQPLFKVRLCT